MRTVEHRPSLAPRAALAVRQEALGCLGSATKAPASAGTCALDPARDAGRRRRPARRAARSRNPAASPSARRAIRTSPGLHSRQDAVSRRPGSRGRAAAAPSRTAAGPTTPLVAAGEEAHEAGGPALDGVAARLAAPFAAASIGVASAPSVSRAKATARLDQRAPTPAPSGRGSTTAREHVVAAARTAGRGRRAPPPRSRPWAGCGGPAATTVSAARTKRARRGDAAALARARRCA